jgi:hypothetical protein
VNNAGLTAVQLFVIAQPDTGGPPLIGPLATLGVGMGTVFTEPQVASAATRLGSRHRLCWSIPVVSSTM